MKRITASLLVFSALLLLGTGCASTGRSELTEAVATKLNQFKTATVSVQSAVTKPPEQVATWVAQLESRIIAKLRTEKAFEKVYPAATDSVGDLQIVVTITGVRDINNFNRVMWGAFAGQASTRARVQLKEQSSGNLLGSGEIEGKSSGGSVMAGTTSESVDRVADEVVRLIRDNM